MNGILRYYPVAGNMANGADVVHVLIVVIKITVKEKTLPSLESGDDFGLLLMTGPVHLPQFLINSGQFYGKISGNLE